MKKFAKFLLKALFSFIVIILIVIVSVQLFFDPNHYKTEISQLVKEKVGRDFKIIGDMQLSFFPWLGVEVGTMQLGNPGNFNDLIFARIANAKVQVKLLSLLSNNIEIDTVILEKAELFLIRNKAGQSNWEDLAQLGSQDDKQQSSDKAFKINGLDIREANISWVDDTHQTRYTATHLNLETSAIDLQQPIKILFDTHFKHPDIKGHVVLDTKITLDVAKQNYQLDDVQFSTKVAGRPIPNHEQTFVLNTPQINLDLSQEQLRITKFQLKGLHTILSGTLKAQHILTLHPNLSGQITAVTDKPKKLTQLLNFNQLDPFLQKLHLQTQFNTNFKAITFDHAILNIGGNNQLRSQIYFDVDREILTLNNLNAQLFDTTLKATLKGQHIFQQPEIVGNISLDNVDIPQWLKLLQQPALTLPKPFTAKQGNLSTNVDITSERLKLAKTKLTIDDNQLVSQKTEYNFSKKQLQLENFDLKTLLGLNLNGNLIFNHAKTPYLQGQIATSRFNLAATLQKLNYPLPKMAASDALTAMQLKTKLESDFSYFKLQNLDLKLDQSHLTGKLQVANFAQPAINFDLNIDKLDLDRYLPPSDEKNQEKDDNAALLPIETLRRLNMNGTLKAAKFIVSKVNLSDVYLKVTANQGKIYLSPMNAKLYQGSYVGSLYLNAQDTPPKLKIDKRLNQVKVGKLLHDFMGTALISGTATVTTKLSADVSTWKRLQQSLRGQSQVALLEGIVQGVNLGYAIRYAKSLLKRDKKPKAEPLATDFSSLTASFNVKNGWFYTKDLRLKSPLLRVKGKGKVNIFQQELALALKAAIVETSKGQIGKELEELKGVEVPMKIKGSFQQPQVSVDLKGWFADYTKQKLEQEKKSWLDKYQEQLPSELLQEINRLF